ncbi:hypothetical protein FQA39_LY18615 [Lamprigera yunnana]|nr:hypothetical protein FQA39_LY18615 [Lamprigera yunnana]
MARPPSTGAGIDMMMAPNLGVKPRKIENTPATRKTSVEYTRVTSHHAHVLGGGGQGGAAEEAGDHRRETGADEAAPDERIEVAVHHGADGFEVAQVFGHQDDDHRGDHGDRICLEHGEHEGGRAKPGRSGDRGEVDDGRAAAACRQRVQQAVAAMTTPIEGEAGAQVAGKAPAGDDEEDDAWQRRRTLMDMFRVEPHQHGRQHGAAEHGDDVLHAHDDGLPGGHGVSSA